MNGRKFSGYNAHTLINKPRQWAFVLLVYYQLGSFLSELFGG